jgi:hypothetical protein
MWDGDGRLHGEEKRKERGAAQSMAVNHQSQITNRNRQSTIVNRQSITGRGSRVPAIHPW